MNIEITDRTETRQTVFYNYNYLQNKRWAYRYIKVKVCEGV